MQLYRGHEQQVERETDGSNFEVVGERIMDVYEEKLIPRAVRESVVRRQRDENNDVYHLLQVGQRIKKNEYKCHTGGKKRK